MKINICIFLLVLIATFVYACGPQEHPIVAPVTSIPVIPPVLLVTRIPRPPSTAVMTVSPPAPTQIVVVLATAAPAPSPAPQVAPAAAAVPAARAAVPAAPAAPVAAQVGPAAAGAQAAAAPAAAAPGGGAQAAAAPVVRAGGQPGPAPGVGRKKRSVDSSKIKKCRSAEFDVFMDHKNISQETSEIVEKLELKVESIQKIFNNTMNRIEIESVRDEKLKITYKVDAECNTVRHVMLDALVEIKAIQSIVIKCKCQPSFVICKKDFKI